VDLENAIRQVIASDEYQASLSRPVDHRLLSCESPKRGRAASESQTSRSVSQIESQQKCSCSMAAHWLRVGPLTDPGRTFRFEQLYDAMTRNGYALPISMSRLDRPLAACAGYMCQRQHNQGWPA
jgi:hypothetical protein